MKSIANSNKEISNDFYRISDGKEIENDDSHYSSIHKMKYKRAAKELEFTS